MFFKRPQKVQNIKNGSLVKIKNDFCIKDDRDYYVVLNRVFNFKELNDDDEFDDGNLLGLIWGMNEKKEIEKDVHLRLWNHQLKKFLVIGQNYLELIND